MRTINDFHKEWHAHISGAGLGIDIPQVVAFMNHVMNNLSKIEGFKLIEVSTVRGVPRVQSNLIELMPWVAAVIHEEIEDKISLVMKVEFEVEQRLNSIGLDINGKPLQNE
tara:strand:+ start:572 stop:904 length:333 start_codon:yes stop_codon:yes gene_type:complete